MNVAAFLRMVDEEVKKYHIAGVTWTLTVARQIMRLQFDTRDDVHLQFSMPLIEVEQIHPAALRLSIQMALRKLMETRLQARYNDWRSPWETE